MSRLILKPRAWPELHQRRFAELFAEGDVLDGQGRGFGWSAGRRCKRTQTYGHWLAFLDKTQMLDVTIEPVRLLTPEAVEAFAAATADRISTKSTSMQAEDLLAIARCFDPSLDWLWLKRLSDRLRRKAGPDELKPRAPVSAADLFKWSLQTARPGR